MLAKMKVAMALLLVASAPALADSIDGQPMPRTDRRPPASVRGSPSILFEDRGLILREDSGWAGPLDTCMTDDGYGRTRSCSAGGGF
jgi:hypothetical protein